MALWSPDGRTQMSGFPGGAPKINPSGQAQPIQPQSQGTPYGSPTKPPPPGMVYNKAPSSQATNFSAYAPPQQSAPQSNPFAQYNPQQIGNVFQQQSGLPSFQFTATDSFGNTYNNPAALTAQQGAMAQAMNAQRAQQIQSGNIGPLNPMAAYQQAQNMVQGGWTNPFSAPMPNMGSQNNYGYGDTRPPLKSQAQPVQPPSQGAPYGGQQDIGIGPGLRAFDGYATEEEAKRAAYEARLDPMWRDAVKSQGREWNPHLIKATQEQIDSGEYMYGARSNPFSGSGDASPPLVGLGNAPGPDGRPSGGGSVWIHPTDGGKYYKPKYGTPEYEAWDKFDKESSAREQARFRSAWQDVQARNPYNAGDYAVKTGLSPGKYFATYTPGQTQPTPPRPGQAQPIQPPSQGNPYNGAHVLYAPSAPQQPAQPDPQRQRDQAAYEEVMQQLRIGGSAFDNMRADRRRAELEKRLGMSQTSAPQLVQPPAATPAPPRQANPNTPTFGVYPPGTVSSPDSPVPAPPRPAPQDRPSATPVLRAPQVWTNPSDPASFIKDLQSRGDTRPVVYDEKTRTYINNPYFAGAPGYEAFLPQRPSPAPPAQPAQQPYYDVLYGPSSNPYAGMPRNDALPYDMLKPWALASGVSNSRRAAPGRL